MQPEQIPATSTPLESRARFSLRELFFGTTMAAAALAAVAPWFWHWDSEQRAAFFYVWCSMTLGAAAMSAFSCWRRVREEIPAGFVRFRLPQTVMSRIVSFSRIALVLCLAVYMLLKFSRAPFGNSPDIRIRWVAVLCAFVIGMIFDPATFWIVLKSEAYLELCDAGIVGCKEILPWSDIRGFRWGDSVPNLLVLQRQREILTFQVHFEDKPPIERILTSRLAENAGPADSKPVDGKGRLPE